MVPVTTFEVLSDTVDGFEHAILIRCDIWPRDLEREGGCDLKMRIIYD
jgi:hypothetical protein